MFEVQLTFEMITARATTFIFDTRTGVLSKYQSFLDRICLDLRGTRTPTLRIHAERSNLLSYQGARHLLSHVFEHWLWRYRYFEVELTFEMVTVRGHQHSFSTY